MQFTIVLLKNLVLFPPEQLNFIIAFCGSTRSIFSIYSLHVCPRRSVCARLSFVGLRLSQIHTTTHRGPSLHPPRSPGKPTFSCQCPFQCWLFNITSFRPLVSVSSCMLGLTHVVLHFKIKLPSCSDSSESSLTRAGCACFTSAITHSVGETSELR